VKVHSQLSHIGHPGDNVLEVLVFTLAHGPSINMKKEIGQDMVRDYLNGQHLGKNHYDQ
jgi:hypothetical protein